MVKKTQRAQDIKNLARFAAHMFNEEKAGDWIWHMDKNEVYGVVLLLKEFGLDITSAALDDLLEKVDRERLEAQCRHSLTDEIKRRFSDLAGELSPENLCCDGELPHSQVIIKERRLRKEWADLEQKVGRKVTENEVWDWIIKR